MDTVRNEPEAGDYTAPIGFRAQLYLEISNALKNAGNDADTLREELHNAVDRTFDTVELGTEESKTTVKYFIDEVRRSLQWPRSNLKKSHPILEFPGETLSTIAEILTLHEERVKEGAVWADETDYHLRPRRVNIAVLGTLIGSSEPLTPHMISERTGYSESTIVGSISSIKGIFKITGGWVLKGRSETGWIVERV